MKAPDCWEAPPGPQPNPTAPTDEKRDGEPRKGLPWLRWALGMIVVLLFLLTSGCPRLPEVMMTRDVLDVAPPAQEIETILAGAMAFRGHDDHVPRGGQR